MKQTLDTIVLIFVWIALTFLVGTIMSIGMAMHQ